MNVRPIREQDLEIWNDFTFAFEVSTNLLRYLLSTYRTTFHQSKQKNPCPGESLSGFLFVQDLGLKRDLYQFSHFSVKARQNNEASFISSLLVKPM